MRCMPCHCCRHIVNEKLLYLFSFFPYFWFALRVLPYREPHLCFHCTFLELRVMFAVNWLCTPISFQWCHIYSVCRLHSFVVFIKQELSCETRLPFFVLSLPIRLFLWISGTEIKPCFACYESVAIKVFRNWKLVWRSSKALKEQFVNITYGSSEWHQIASISIRSLSLVPINLGT